jgi:hypothetical protein
MVTITTTDVPLISISLLAAISGLLIPSDFQVKSLISGPNHLRAVHDASMGICRGDESLNAQLSCCTCVSFPPLLGCRPAKVCRILEWPIQVFSKDFQQEHHTCHLQEASPARATTHFRVKHHPPVSSALNNAELRSREYRHVTTRSLARFS